MTTGEMTRAELDVLIHEIREMRKELAAVHYEVAATLQTCATASPAMRSHCPTCGGALDHHRAMAGDLQICAACGWSQFVDRRAGALPASEPIPVPLDTSPSIPWAS